MYNVDLSDLYIDMSVLHVDYVRKQLSWLGHRRYMAEILQIRRKTPFNQSINQSWLGTTD